MSAVPSTVCKRILLVEDHAASAAAIEALLKHDGHQVTLARDCAQAKDLCGSDAEFDVLLLDIILPDGSALDLAGRFRQRYPHSRLVAVTAMGMERDITAIKAAGFHAHVLKPFRIEQLLAQVH